MADPEVEVWKWLEKQGYPLEMAVAQEFRRAGFAVSQSSYYQDQQSHEWREIDVIASTMLKRSGSDIEFMRLALAISCKAPPRPWVLFCHPSADSEATPIGIARSIPNTDGGFRLLAYGATDEHRSGMYPALLKIPERIGHGLAVVSDKNRDLAYEGYVSAVKAAVDQVPQPEDEDDDPRAFFALPVLVVSGPLFHAYLNESGEMQLEPADYGWLIWRQPVMTQRQTLVWVVTAPTVAGFADNAVELFATLRRWADVRAASFVNSPSDKWSLDAG
jgi:hypothetical protein